VARLSQAPSAQTINTAFNFCEFNMVIVGNTNFDVLHIFRDETKYFPFNVIVYP
jgi:hypothetical protein